MADPTNNDASDTREPTVRFGVRTPFGIKEIDLSEIPDELRDSLVESLSAEGLPDSLRHALAKTLGVDLDASAAGAEDATPAAATVDQAEADDHAPACNCEQLHRERIWGILDAAFPNEPHLWRAMEALFTAAATNPHKITDETRNSALHDAAQHLQRQIELNTPVLGPLEQMVEQFRKEMGL